MVLPSHRWEASGPELLMIPGANGHRDWLEPLARALSGRHRILVPTLPGEPEAPAGGPNPHDSPLEQTVEALAATLDHHGYRSPVVFGTSFGAILALHLALMKPERVSGLVLHAGTARPAVLLAPWADVLRRPLTALLVFNVILLRGVIPEVAHTLAVPGGHHRLRLVLGRRLVTPWSPQAVGHRLQRLQDVDLRPRLSSIACPALVVSADEGLDAIIPSSEGPLLAGALADARHEVLRGTGHLAPLLAPEALATVTRSFLDEVSAA